MTGHYETGSGRYHAGEAAVKLKDMALENDSRDNVTCLIIHVVALQPPSAATS